MELLIGESTLEWYTLIDNDENKHYLSDDLVDFIKSLPTTNIEVMNSINKHRESPEVGTIVGQVPIIFKPIIELEIIESNLDGYEIMIYPGKKFICVTITKDNELMVSLDDLEDYVELYKKYHSNNTKSARKI